MVRHAFLMLAIATLTTGQYDPDMQVCWREAYCRGAGTVPNECKNGYEFSAGLCYPGCADGYYGVGPVCWQYCPEGWTDIGALCTIPMDVYFPCPWYDICGLTFAKGCTINCSEGYQNDGCSCRRPAQTIAKKSYGRTAGIVPTCNPKLEENAGLCYEPCKGYYVGLGPVCWRNDSGNSSYQIECNPFAYGGTVADCDELTGTLKEAGITAIVCIGSLVATIISGHLVGPLVCQKQIKEVLPKLVKVNTCSYQV